jgi:hypothetical protein
MKINRNYRLTLECVILVTELARLAIKIVALVGTAINYPHEPQVVEQVQA